MRLTALVLLLALVCLAVFAVLHVPGSYVTQDRGHITEGSTGRHLLGTDSLGRDRTVRIAVAILLGLAGSIAASALATSLAVSIGVLSAFAVSWLGKVLMYVCDLFLTLPWIFLLMTIRAALPLNFSAVRSAEITFLLLGLLGAPVFVRVNYARASMLRNAEWLLYGRASGLRTSQIVHQHLLPHLKVLFLTQFLLYIPISLVAEANLGTLGLGISQPLPSWGSMLQELESPVVMTGSHWVFLPAVLLVVVLLLLELLVFEEEA